MKNIKKNVLLKKYKYVIRSNHIITSCIKRKKITTNSTNPYFIVATFQTKIYNSTYIFTS